MNAETILALVGTTGFAAVFGAVITGVFNRKKLGAEATEIIAKAASNVVEMLKADNLVLRNRELEHDNKIDVFEKRVENLEAHIDNREKAFTRYVEAQRLTLLAHAAFDHMLIEKATAFGMTDLPEPPPLQPPPDLRYERRHHDAYVLHERRQFNH